LDESGYIIGNNDGDLERSTVRNIYAIGDVLKVVHNNNDDGSGFKVFLFIVELLIIEALIF